MRRARISSSRSRTSPSIRERVAKTVFPSGGSRARGRGRRCDQGGACWAAAVGERPLLVRGAHAERERGGQVQVDGRDREPLPRVHVEVALEGRVVAPPPALPELEPADRDDDEEHRARPDERERDEAREAHDPEERVEDGRRPAAVERGQRDQVEQVEQERRERQRDEQLRADRLADAPDHKRRGAPEDRPRQPQPRLGGGVLAAVAGEHHRAHERDEVDALDGDALPARLDHVPELVDEEERDEAGREAPAPEPRVRRHRDEHGPGGGEELELEDEQRGRLELREQGGDRGHRRRDAPAETAQPAAGMDRLVAPQVAGVGHRPRRAALGLREGRDLAHQPSAAPAPTSSPTSASSRSWSSPRVTTRSQPAARAARMTSTRVWPAKARTGIAARSGSPFRAPTRSGPSKAPASSWTTRQSGLRSARASPRRAGPATFLLSQPAAERLSATFWRMNRSPITVSTSPSDPLMPLMVVPPEIRRPPEASCPGGRRARREKTETRWTHQAPWRAV